MVRRTRPAKQAADSRIGTMREPHLIGSGSRIAPTPAVNAATRRPPNRRALVDPDALTVV